VPAFNHCCRAHRDIPVRKTYPALLRRLPRGAKSSTRFCRKLPREHSPPFRALFRVGRTRAGRFQAVPSPMLRSILPAPANTSRISRAASGATMAVSPHPRPAGHSIPSEWLIRFQFTPAGPKAIPTQNRPVALRRRTVQDRAAAKGGGEIAPVAPRSCREQPFSFKERWALGDSLARTRKRRSISPPPVPAKRSFLDGYAQDVLSKKMRDVCRST